MIESGAWKQMRSMSKPVTKEVAAIRSQSMRTTRLKNDGSVREPSKRMPSLPKLKFMEGDVNE